MSSRSVLLLTQSPGNRKAIFDRLTPKTRSLLLSFYRDAHEFIYAEITGAYVSYLEEACLTYEAALEFDPSALVVLQILTEATGHNYLKDAEGVYPLLAAETAIQHAILHRKISLTQNTLP